MELTSRELELLTFVYAKGQWCTLPGRSVLLWGRELHRLVDDLGFLVAEGSPEKKALRITDRGCKCILEYDPIVMTYSFLRGRFLNHAAYWIQRFIPRAGLSEFLICSDPFIRETACDKMAGKCSHLVFPEQAVY